MVHDGHRAALTNRQVVFTSSRDRPDPRVAFPETYDLLDNGKAVTFWSIIPGTLESAMYRLNVADGTLTRFPSEGAHNETHVFPDQRHGLEESNRASDPSGPARGVSGIPARAIAALLKRNGSEGQIDAAANAAKPFDVYISSVLDRRPPRRLTCYSDRGGEAHQSAPSPMDAELHMQCATSRK